VDKLNEDLKAMVTPSRVRASSVMKRLCALRPPNSNYKGGGSDLMSPQHVTLIAQGCCDR